MGKFLESKWRLSFHDINSFTMGTCRICQKKSSLISRELGLCLDAARQAGLKRVRVGNTHLLDTGGFEEFLEILELLNPDVELIVIDEIGKMELFSDRFRSLVRDVLNSNKQLLAVSVLEGEGFIRDIKQRSDIHLLEVTQGNRERLPEEMVEGW